MCPVQLISGWQLLSVFHLFSLFTSPLIRSLWRGKSNSFGFSLASNTTAYLESPPTIKFLSQCQWLCWVSGTCQELWSLYFVCSFYDGYQAPTEMGHVNNLPKDRVVSQCIGMNLFLHPGLRLLWWHGGANVKLELCVQFRVNLLQLYCLWPQTRSRGSTLTTVLGTKVTLCLWDCAHCCPGLSTLAY